MGAALGAQCPSAAGERRPRERGGGDGADNGAGL